MVDILTIRMLAVSGVAQNALDGSVLPGYNEVRMKEFANISSALDPDFRAAAEEHERREAEKAAPAPAPADTSPRLGRFLAERERMAGAVGEATTKEEFLRL